MSVIEAPCIDNRMKGSQVDDKRVLDVWSWCSDAYLRYGRRLSLPAGTDPVKTYQWRYATAIAKKFSEWELTDEAAKKFIDIAVRTAKERGLMQKGLAILHQANMLAVCYDKLMAESTTNTQVIDSLQHIHDWLHTKCGDRDVLSTLLVRERRGGYCNLTLWSQASRLSPLYLALSRPCGKVLVRLSRDYPDERGLLPQQTTLYLLRQEFLKDRKNLDHARLIFVHDWREPCLSPS